jgi:hypothetical protein
VLLGSDLTSASHGSPSTKECDFSVLRRNEPLKRGSLRDKPKVLGTAETAYVALPGWRPRATRSWGTGPKREIRVPLPLACPAFQRT